jgi:hypothetical protein
MDAELRDLVAQARALKTEHLASDFAHEAGRVPEETFPEVISRAEGEAAAQWARGGPDLELHTAWSRGMLGPGATEAEVHALARRRIFLYRVNKAMQPRVGDCLAAPVVGDGLDTLRTAGRGVVIAFTHSGVTNATAYAVPRRAGRPIYMPADVPRLNSHDAQPEPDPVLPPVMLSLLYHGEHAGLRWTPAYRRLEVYRELVLAGEPCALAVDQPGHGRATVFGQIRWTSTAPAVLARMTGAPVIVATGYLRSTAFGIVCSAPLQPGSYGSDEELHREILRTAEVQLDHDPGQILGVFPNAEPSTYADRRSHLNAAVRAATTAIADVAATREQLVIARERLAQTRKRLTELRADRATPQDEIAAQQKIAEAASVDLEEARRRFDDARQRRDAAIAERRRAAIAAVG